MKIGLQVPYFTWPGGPERIGQTFANVARGAEDAGFASLWVMDHFFQIPGVGAAENEMLEGYTALAFAAAKTSKIKLGTMVTGATYRHPGILVKTATTLDVVSGGRAYFGIGAGWFEREHVGLGVPFPPMKERFQRLEEQLQIAHQMWNPDANGAFEGKHYNLAETLCSPMPLSKPHPPILIGGRGEKKTLRFVAKYADASNVGVGFDDNSVEDFRRLAGILREHCDREERAYDRIEKTTLGTLWMTPNRHDERWLEPGQALERLGKFREAGVDQAIFNMPNVDRPETLEYVARNVIEPAAKL